MIVLAINFGHDSSLALFRDGRLLAFRELERSTRKKHSVGIAARDLARFLEDCRRDFGAIDVAGLCGTQWWNAKHESAIAQSVAGGTLFDVLGEIEARGGVPVPINTSFNGAGEPIVETAAEAARSFLALGFDYLFLDGRIYRPRDGAAAAHR